MIGWVNVKKANVHLCCPLIYWSLFKMPATDSRTPISPFIISLSIKMAILARLALSFSSIALKQSILFQHQNPVTGLSFCVFIYCKGQQTSPVLFKRRFFFNQHHLYFML